MSIFDYLEVGKRFRLELPQDLISEEGIAEVNEYLRGVYYDRWRELRNDLGEFEVWLNRDFPRDWVVGKGPYVGTFPKRVTNWLFKERQIKATSEVISSIGNIARKHTNSHKDFEFDFADEFRWRAGAFGDSGSCYWSGNDDARYMLEHYDARAIRFFEPGTDKGIGRAWLARLTDHSDVLGEAAQETDRYGRYVRTKPQIDRSQVVVMFNAYGKFETVRVARMLATFLSVSYKTVEVLNGGRSDGKLWINHYRDGIHGGGRGFLLGLPENIDPVDFVDLNYTRYERPRMPDWNCRACSAELFDGDDNVRTGEDGYVYCEGCFSERFADCDHCTSSVLHDDTFTVYVGTQHTEQYWCSACTLADAARCADCDNTHTDAQMRLGLDGYRYCEECYDERYTTCDDCGEVSPASEEHFCEEPVHEL